MRIKPENATCDFYVGMGAEAEWIGTAYDEADQCALSDWGVLGWPEDRDFDEELFRGRVAEMLDDYDRDETMPGSLAPPSAWPHSHPDSTDTDYAVCFTPKAKTVTLYEKGRQVAIFYPNGSRAAQVFPTMERRAS